MSLGTLMRVSLPVCLGTCCDCPGRFVAVPRAEELVARKAVATVDADRAETVGLDLSSPLPDEVKGWWPGATSPPRETCFQECPRA